MSKLLLNKPVLILVYGYPGSGKTFFARKFCESVSVTHIDSDRIRSEVFENPVYSKQEEEIVHNITFYLVEEFLKAGVSVIYDVNALRFLQRKTLRELARKNNAGQMLVWLQTDIESSFLRVAKRDKRKADDKYATPYDRSSFEDYIKRMQNPKEEDYVVVSGKHTFSTQKSAVFKKLYELGFVASEEANNQVVKPGLINLVPTLRQGRVDPTRRNIVIR